jgi:hypothetical protein
LIAALPTGPSLSLRLVGEAASGAPTHLRERAYDY